MSHHDGSVADADLRTRFWAASRGVIEDPGLPWGHRFDRLDVVVAAHGGVNLAYAPPPSCAPGNEPGWLGGPEDPRATGFRGFVIHWRAGQQTSIHGHPDVMYVKVLSGRYRIDDYHVSDAGEARPVAVRYLGSDDRCVAAVADREETPSIHRITCVEDGQTLHVYSDDPARSPRYPDPDHG